MTLFLLGMVVLSIIFICVHNAQMKKIEAESAAKTELIGAQSRALETLLWDIENYFPEYCEHVIAHGYLEEIAYLKNYDAEDCIVMQEIFNAMDTVSVVFDDKYTLSNHGE